MLDFKGHIENGLRRVAIFTAMSGALRGKRIIRVHFGKGSSALRRFQNSIGAFDRRVPFGVY